jgi:hypothetical protein
MFNAGMVVLGLISETSDRGVTVGFANGATGFATTASLKPGIPYAVGDAVVARVHEVHASSRRLILNLHTPYAIGLETPLHWQDGIWRWTERIGSLINGSMTVHKPRRLRLSFDSPEQATSGLEMIASLFQLPAAAVAIPNTKKGRVIGVGGETIRQLQALPGIWSCQFIDDGSNLTLVGESSDTLRATISEVINIAATAFTATMTVPYAEANGALIGKGGATINQLKRDSGCQSAESARGTTTWRLRARSAQSISRFVELANGIVAGCTADVVTPVDLPVIDLSTGEPVQDWRNHLFGQVPLQGWDPPVPHAPIDLRPA